MTRSILGFVLCLMVASAFAQTTVTNVTTKIVELWPRPWGFHIVIEPAAGNQFTSLGVSCTRNDVPVLLPSRGEYKSTKDALVLAYAMKKTIRVHVETTPGVDRCFTGYHPNIYAIDVLEN